MSRNILNCREIEKREKHYMPSIRVWSSDNPLPQIEYMDSLWLQIKNMRNNNWEVSTRLFIKIDEPF